MKVAFYQTTILEYGGGLEKYLIETSSGLNRFCQTEVDIVTMDDEFTKKIVNLLSIYYFKKISKDRIMEIIYKEPMESIKAKLGKANYVKCKDFKSLKKKLREYNVIYSKNEMLEAFIFKVIVGYKNVPPIIFGVHTPHVFNIAKTFYARLHNVLYGSFIYNFLVSGVSGFHVSNSDSLTVLKKQFKRKRIEKIKYPFNCEDFFKKSLDYELKFSFNKKKVNIAWVGRLTEQKGIDDMVWIVDNINNDKNLFDKIEWNICGDGEQKKKILKLRKRWDNVNYLGHVKNDFIASFLKSNSCLISTSKWEVSPFNVTEAQSMGLPVFGYAISGLNDIVINGKTGILVNNKESLAVEIGKFIVNREQFNFSGIVDNIKNNFNPADIYSKLNMFICEIMEKNMQSINKKK